MGQQKALTYGEIADTILPSVVFTLDTLKSLAQAVDSYVELAPRARRVFFQQQMESIWPEAIDWARRPQTPEFKSQWAALRRYFKEQGRIRGPTALPEKLSNRKWTALRVCGIVYKDSIDEMVFLGTGMRPGDPRGYVGQRMKCRTVFYWKLSPGDRKELTEMAKDWQSGALPNEQKMESYYRRFQTWIRDVHLTALRQFGQHLVTMSIPEPGLTNPPRLYEFMHELKILEKPLVKLVPIGDTLSDIYLEVNHAAGRIEGAALPAVLNKKSRLKRKTTWSLDRESFVGHDGILLREEEFDEDLFYKEAISMVYMIVRMAHCNISGDQDLDPPWTSFPELVDEQYILPDVPMCIPTSLRQPNCFKYLKHWFTVTKGLRFDRWQRKNGLPRDPVPLQERWWAGSLPDFFEPQEQLPPAAQAAMHYVPQCQTSGAESDYSAGRSPFGSAGGHLVHDEAVREQEAVDMLEVPAVPDPDDRWSIPLSPQEAARITADADTPPCLVPQNGEARAQWCLIQLQNRCKLPLRATRSLRRAIQQLAELPMVPNGSYPLKIAGKRTGLPTDLSWVLTSPAAPDTMGDMETWLTFLQSSPWSIRQGTADIFAGTELAWCFLLGWVLYLRGYCTAGGLGTGDSPAGIYAVGAASFSKIFADFHGVLCGYAEQYAYPGWAPSAKYALVSSRSHYLAYLVRNEDQDLLLPLLKLVVRMEDGPLQSPFQVIQHSSSPDAPSWISDGNGVPSWQWPRCGLPPCSHGDPNLPELLYSWFRRVDLLADGGVARSRETGLAVMLKVALIYSDLENLDDQRWFDGAAALEDSCLRGHTRQLKTAVADWANEQAILLEPLLPPCMSDALDEDEGEYSGQAEFASAEALPRASSLTVSKRGAVSETMPGDMNSDFMAVDLEDIALPHTVGEYREWTQAQPRTAVQELSRKGLLGMAELDERKKTNKALRRGASLVGKSPAPKSVNPAPRRTAGAWLPMPTSGGVESDGENRDEDEPPRKRRRTLIVKRIRSPPPPKASHLGKLKRPRRGRKLGGAGNPSRTRAATAPGRKRKAPVLEDSEPSQSSSESDSVLEFSQEEPDGAWSSPGVSEPDEMPERISSPRRSRFNAPLLFDASGNSSSVDVDSDEIGSARSIRRSAPLRLAFVAPQSTLALPGATARLAPSSTPARARPRPRPSARSRALHAERWGEPDSNDAGDASLGAGGDLRRSARLKSSAAAALDM